MKIDRIKKNKKISSTAYRVLLLLKLLNEKNLGIEDLNAILSQDPNISRTFSNEVILKYISTLRLAGYKITKPCVSNNYTYNLIKAPVRIKLSEDELNSFIFFDTFMSNISQKNLQEAKNKLFENLFRYMNDDDISRYNKLKKSYKNNNSLNTKFQKYTPIASKFEQYCIDEQKIIIKYKYPFKKEIQIILEPKYVEYIGEDIYFCGYDPIIGERQLINVDYIAEMKQLPVKSSSNYILSPVIFKLKGRLAKSYELHESEKITEINSETDTITITTYADCKTMLMQRLLKYGDLCEVLYPKAFREKIANEIYKTIKNYEKDYK
ncbi:MAG: hypothetical protein PHC34_10005 [Candidatus Gastranaerophilales bacterium]|nr:hypothetical protein [Candidatus Gastranaerophilales bacterium]